MPRRLNLPDNPRPLEAMPEIMRPAEVCEVLRCGLQRFYSLCRSGGLPHFRLSNAKSAPFLVDREALRAWLRARRGTT